MKPGVRGSIRNIISRVWARACRDGFRREFVARESDFSITATGNIGRHCAQEPDCGRIKRLLGVNHKTYYKNTPLVYDAIEPFRAFADYALCNYMAGCREPDMREWSVFFGNF